MIDNLIKLFLKESEIRKTLMDYVFQLDLERIPLFLSNICTSEQRMLDLENRIYIEQTKTIKLKRK